MLGSIVVGVILGVVFWRMPMVGAVLGGMFGWLFWKVIALSMTVESLQNSVDSLSKQAEQGFTTDQIHHDLDHMPEVAEGLSNPVGQGFINDQIHHDLDHIPETTEAEGAAEAAAYASYAVEQTHVEMAEDVALESEFSTASKDHAVKSAALGERQETSAAKASQVAWEQAESPFMTQAFKYFEAIVTWFVSGNMLVRVGSVVLFFGAAFLLKYAAEHSHISIEMRMLGIVLGASAMLVVGWYLRSSRPIYGLALQGGGLGLLYLTIYASFRLYDLIPASQALVLLALIAGAGVAMAVRYNARWLAILSFAGGFLAPVLASTGSGSHVALFSWYAVLNIGIAILAWHKAWRSLNLLGMIATFVIAALWGNQYYQPLFFDSVEPFLVGFGVLYVLIGVLFSLHRADPEQEGFGRVDASIIFGTPIGFFLLQTPLVHDFEHGMSLSALLSGLLYAGAAYLAWRHENKVLMIALLSLAVGLLSLAIPLEFDELETAGAWAMEGVGLVWLGLLQKSQRAVFTGLVLQGLAVFCWFLGSPLSPNASYGSTLSACFIALSGWACALLLGRSRVVWKELCMGDSVSVGIFVSLQFWGLLWWLGAGFTELNRHVDGHDLLLCMMVWTLLSAYLVEYMGMRLKWYVFRRINIGLIFVWLQALMLQTSYVAHPMQDWAWMVWLPAIFSSYWFLYRDDQRSLQQDTGIQTEGMVNVLHILTASFLLLFFTWELHWQVSEWLAGPLHMPILSLLVLGMVPAVLLLFISQFSLYWPIGLRRASYLKITGGIFVCVMLAWFAWMLPNAVNDPWPYIPLLNSLDITLALLFFSLFGWYRSLQCHAMMWFERWHFHACFGALLFMAVNMDIARVVHHSFAVPWNIHAMMKSVELQAALSLCWSLLALALMAWASRKGVRMVWLLGAGLISMVVIKLFMVDLSGTGTLARIVSFLGVGGLLLLIGYLSPVPPESESVDEQADADTKHEQA